MLQCLEERFQSGDFLVQLRIQIRPKVTTLTTWSPSLLPQYELRPVFFPGQHGEMSDFLVNKKLLGMLVLVKGKISHWLQVSSV